MATRLSSKDSVAIGGFTSPLAPRSWASRPGTKGAVELAPPHGTLPTGIWPFRVDGACKIPASYS